jgi:hypothetical protein
MQVPNRICIRRLAKVGRIVVDDDAHMVNGDQTDSDENWAGPGYIQVEDTAECPNCWSRVEPEQEGDVVFYECECGVAFGYRLVKSEETCAAGLPLAHLATLRGVPPEEAAAFGKTLGLPETGVFLGSVIPLRPADN